MKTVAEICRDAYANALAKGFYEGAKPSIGDRLALIHSEVSEALEEYRAGHPLTEIYEGENGKLEGFPIELADAVIRIADLCGWLGIDLEAAIARKMAFNATRPHRHGGKVI